MYKIDLGNGNITIIDINDVILALSYSWHLTSSGYVRGRVGTNTKSLHSMVMGLPIPPLIVDHINGDKLDNRKSNLRICKQGQNVMNRKPCIKVMASRHRGVWWDKDKKRWRVEIQSEKVRHKLGNYKTEEEAALAYNTGAIKYHGEFARLNVI